jgi:hypothetical protein
VLFEVVAPLLEVVGYGVLVALLATGYVAGEFALAFLLLILLLGLLQTAGAILIEEVGFSRYHSRDLLLVVAWGALETLWYKPLTAFWRTWASFLWITGRRPGWGSIPRGGALAEHPVPAPDELAAAPAPLSR